MAHRPVLAVLVASTRPGRIGPVFGDWIADLAREHGGFDVEVVDLAELNLPMFDEPHHPRLGRYQHEHTKRWSQIVDRADAFVFVMPEYNYGYTAPLKNAIDYLHNEWAYKPVGFVSYGGASGGLRAVQLLKPVLTTLKLHPVTEGVALHNVFSLLGEDRSFTASPETAAAGTAMLDELLRWSTALAGLREKRVETAA